MKQYHDLLQHILDNGTYKPAAREGMPGTYSVFGYQNRYDLSEGFPLLTTKKLNWKNIVTELLWFLRGDTNIKYLVDNGCNIWSEDAFNFYIKLAKQLNLNPVSFEFFDSLIKHTKADQLDIVSEELGIPNYTIGDTGKQYGWLWRSLQGVHVHPADEEDEFDGDWDCTIVTTDQVKELIDGLKTNPMSRRHIITAWNPATLDDMALPACHSFVQFNCKTLTLDERIEFGLQNYYITKRELAFDILDNPERTIEEQLNDCNVPKHYLDCQLYQRSADVFLGVPYNIASYALLTHIIAKLCNMIPGEFIHTFGDVHLYENHVEQAKLQLTREEKPLPTLKINEPLDGVWDFNEMVNYISHTDFIIEGYDPHSAIPAKLSTGLR